MVISGINLGANMGDDTIYSGTVAAATEGYPARHSVDRDLARVEGGAHFETAARRRARAGRAPPRGSRSAAWLLNVNVPDVPRAELTGYRITRLGRRHKAEDVVKSQESARRDRVLGRRRGRGGGRGRRHRFPRGRAAASCRSRRCRSTSPIATRCRRWRPGSVESAQPTCSAERRRTARMGTMATRDEKHVRHRHDVEAHARRA